MIEKVDDGASHVLPNAMLISTKQKVTFSQWMVWCIHLLKLLVNFISSFTDVICYFQNNYLFARLPERKVMLDKMSDYLSKLKMPKRYVSSMYFNYI